MEIRNLMGLALVLCIGAVSLARAQESEPAWVTVELIIFQQDPLPDQVSEVFPVDPGRPVFAGSVLLRPNVPEEDASAAAAPSAEASPIAPGAAVAADATTEQSPLLPYTELDPSSWILGRIERRLRVNKAYQVLYHAAWRQPLTENSRGTRVRIDVPRPLPKPERGLPEPPLSPPSMPPEAAIAGEVEPMIATDFEQELRNTPLVEGTVRVRQTRYMHMEIDLLYNPVQALDVSEFDRDFGQEALEIKSYRLHEQRRIRAERLHYFDHPRFGVVAEVMPWELPPSTEPQEPAADTVTGSDQDSPAPAQTLPLQ